MARPLRIDRPNRSEGHLGELVLDFIYTADIPLRGFKMFESKMPRRALLKGVLTGLAAIPVVGVFSRANAAPGAMLDAADPQAKALGYVADTTKVDDKARPTHKAEQKCANCVQFQGKAGDANGGCPIFAGRQVAANGWCSVWVKKP